ncbi:MAG: CNNM domain-containing protein [Anaerovoracaceae bacterium]
MNAVILLLLLIGLNAVLAATEIAVMSMNDVKLKKMAEEGNKKAVRLVALTDQPARFLATIRSPSLSKSAAECCSQRLSQTLSS